MTNYADSLFAAVRTACMIAFIIAGASFLTSAMGFTQVPMKLAQAIGEMGLSPTMLLIALTLLLLIMGCFLDGISLILLVTAIIMPVVSAAGTMIWASLVLVPASLLLDEPWTLCPSPLALSAIAALALPCTAGALLLYFRLLRTLGSPGVASQAYLRSGVGVTLGVVVLGEVVTPTMGLGLALAIAGVVLANWPARKPQ